MRGGRGRQCRAACEGARVTAIVTATGQSVARYGIGASEVAAACGMCSFRTPLSLWLEKTGRSEPVAGNDATLWGQILEPLLRAWYCERTRLPVMVPPASLFHPTRKWARCTPDGIALGPNDEQLHLVQCKNVGRRQAWRWGEDVMDPSSVTHEYVCQVAWEMMVTGFHRADLIASIGGSPPVIYTIHRDAQLEADLIEAAGEFWRCVETDTPPKVDGSDDWTRYLAAQMKRDTGAIIPRSGATDALAVQLQDALAMVARAESNADELKNQLRALMVDRAAEAIETDKGQIRWKANVKGARVFTVPKAWRGAADE